MVLHVPAEDLLLKKRLEEMGYYNVRFLRDGVICNGIFIFTTAVLIDVNFFGFEKRVCYSNPSLAERCCLMMSSIEDDPLPGFTAIKGVGIRDNT